MHGAHYQYELHMKTRGISMRDMRDMRSGSVTRSGVLYEILTPVRSQKNFQRDVASCFTCSRGLLPPNGYSFITILASQPQHEATSRKANP